jgi:competence protein ComEC
MRAVIMAILLLFGRLIFNNISMINIVWTSALMILITNPGALFDVGFQLSYSAVVGLITLYPMLQNAFYIKYKLLRITYETFAVSVAAMLSTLPLIIYYFHSLSILSLLSNFIVVPLSTLILYISMFLLAFSKIFFIGDLLGYLLKLLMILMNNCLLFLQKMDTINLINLTLDIKEIALLYLTFGCFALYIQYRKFQFLLVSLISILCAVFIESLETIYFKNQEKIFVYATQKGKAIDVLIKGDLYSYQEEINDKELRNKIAPNQQNIEYKSHFFINPDSTFHDSKVQYKDKLLVAKNTVISIDKCWQNAAVSVANTSYKFNCNNAILLRGKQKIDTDKRWYSKQKGAYVQSINSN